MEAILFNMSLQYRTTILSGQVIPGFQQKRFLSLTLTFHVVLIPQVNKEISFLYHFSGFPPPTLFISDF